MPERFATLGTVYKRFSPMKQMNQRSFIFQSGLIVAVVFILTMPVRGTEPLAQWFGDDFDGGAKKLFGASLHGRERANCVYAKSNGAASQMTARFRLTQVPAEPMFLFMEAMDDDAPSACEVEIVLND